MNRLSLFFILFSLNVYGQNWNYGIDTVYHDNGRIARISHVLIDSIGKHHDAGTFQVFDSLGNLMLNGKYAFRHFIDCNNCYELIDQKAVP